MARFNGTLAVLLQAGTPLLDALATAAATCGHEYYRHRLADCRAGVADGRPLADSLGDSGLVPPLTLELIGLGEATGKLDTMLARAAGYHERRIRDDCERLHSLLEPLIMSILALLVGVLLVAMYLPIFRLGAVL